MLRINSSDEHASYFLQSTLQWHLGNYVTAHTVATTVYAVAVKSHLETLVAHVEALKAHTSTVISLIVVAISRKEAGIACIETEITHIHSFKSTT